MIQNMYSIETPFTTRVSYKQIRTKGPEDGNANLFLCFTYTVKYEESIGGRFLAS